MRKTCNFLAKNKDNILHPLKIHHLSVNANDNAKNPC